MRVAAPFDSQSFIYRTGEFSYERDPYAGFLVPPEESLAEPLRGYLRNSSLFREVTEPGSAIAPDILGEISVTQLYGDFRDRSQPAAVIAMHLTFSRAPPGAPGKVFFEKDYSLRVPLHARTAPALMAGWNTALTEIVAQVCKDLRAELARTAGAP